MPKPLPRLSSIRRSLGNSARIFTLACVAAGAHAAPAPPPGPPPVIDATNWYWGPGNHWSYRHTRRIFPSADIYRGQAPAAKLDYAPRDLDGITFVNPVSRAQMTVAQMYSATETDAFLVMHGGKIVTERYFNGMKPEDTHLLMSVSKSVLGMLAGIVVGEGRLNPDALVTSYVPELQGSAYEGATVRNLLDMTVGMNFDENYASKTSDLYRLDEAAGWVERGPGAADGLHAFLATLTKRSGPHGVEFRYISANTDAMGWVLERATGTDLAGLFSSELWSKIGAERDAYLLLDAHEAPYADPGLNMTLRDLGRFSQMVLQEGRVRGRQIVPAAWIMDIRRGGSPGAWKKSPSYAHLGSREGYANGSYRSYWYIADPQHGYLTAIGLAGQLIVIDPSSQTVVVKFSSHSTPDAAQGDIEYAGAVAIVHALSRDSLKGT